MLTYAFKYAPLGGRHFPCGGHPTIAPHFIPPVACLRHRFNFFGGVLKRRQWPRQCAPHGQSQQHLRKGAMCHEQAKRAECYERASVIHLCRYGERGVFMRRTRQSSGIGSVFFCEWL